MELLNEFYNDHNMKNIFFSGIDLNNSFMIICQKSA